VVWFPRETDWLAEEDEFEPPVPRVRAKGFETATFERFRTFPRCGKAVRNPNLECRAGTFQNLAGWTVGSAG
jgi:hypothetical protein